MLPLLGQEPAKAAADPFEDGMRQAFTAYKKGDNEAVTAKLRELLKLIEEKGAAKLGGLLPETLGAWKGENLKRDEMGVLGGGVSMARTYVSGEHQITVKIVKDSPLVNQMLPLLLNEDLIRMTNRKTHRISGEMGIMEGDNKLQIIVDQRIYVELLGNDGTGETDLVALAEKLDLKAMAKIK
jgi:hypothetical protein